MWSAILALVGVVIGGILTGFTSWLVAGRRIRAEREHARRGELRELLGTFWAEADALWEAEQKLSLSARQVRAARGQEEPPEANYLHRLADEVVGQARTLVEVSRTLDRRLGMIRVLYPELADAATELVQKSKLADAEEGQDDDAADRRDFQARLDALKAFEDAARHVLANSG